MINKITNKANTIMRTLRFCAFAIMLLFVSNVNATHIVGGNMTYRKIGPNRYEITLELRRDCYLGSPEAEFDNPAVVGVFSSNGTLVSNIGFVGQLRIPFNDSDTLNNIVVSDCGFEGEQVCVHETKYVTEVTLPYKPGGYILSYQRCCRNASLNNIVDPLETGATYSVLISEQALLEGNSSAVFKQWPPVYICANEPINFDHGATDIDGDSLVYKLCTPKIGGSFERPKPQPPAGPPYTDLQWKSPFDLNNIMGGNPLRIDPETGVLTGTPISEGQYVIGVCVEEYRNGKLISSTNRDFQYNVRICSDPPTALFNAPTENCDGLTVPFTNQSIASNQFFWNFNYPNGGANFQSSQRDPLFTFPASGAYDVFLKVVRGVDKCSDSIVKTISVFDADIDLLFDAKLATCLSGDSITYTLRDSSTINVNGVNINSWRWVINQGSLTKIVTGNNASVTLAKGDFTVQVNVGATNGCISSLTKSFDFDDFVLVPGFDVTTAGCTTDDRISIALIDSTGLLNPDYTIASRAWTITAGSQTFAASGNGAIVDFPRSDFTVDLVVTASNGCTATLSKSYKIADFVPTAGFKFELNGCSADNNAIIRFSELSNDTILYGTAQSYDWEINGSSLVGQTVDYTNVGADTIVATLSVRFDDGCFARTTQTVIVDAIKPQVAFTWVAESCPTDESVRIKLILDTTKVYGYDFGTVNWTSGLLSNPATLDGNEVFVTIPKDSTTFGVVSTNFTNGCNDDFSLVFDPGTFAVISLRTDSITLCPFEDATVVVNPNPLFTYTWTPTEGLDLTTPSQPTISVGRDITYYVVVSDGLCEVKDSIVVDILEQLAVVAAGDTFTCDRSVTLNASGGVGPGVYEWSTDIDFSTIIFTGNQLNETFTGDVETYYVRFRGEVCEALPTSVTVTYEVPEVELVAPLSMCVYDTVSFQLVNLDVDHNISAAWKPDPHIISGLNSLQPLVAVFEGETNPFTLYYTVTNQFGCEYSDSIVVQIGINPNVDFTIDVVDCDNFEVCVKTVGTFLGFPAWDMGDMSSTADISFLNNYCYTYPSEGTYIITLENRSSTCEFARVQKTITLKKDVPIFDKDTVDICIDSILTLPVPASVSGFDFVWCDASGTEISKANPLILKISALQSIILKATDELGCPFRDTIVANPFSFSYTLDIPEVFCARIPTQASINVAGNVSYIYSWTPEACIAAGSTTATPVLVIDSRKTINVQVTHPTLGCILRESFTVEPTDLIIDVNAAPDAEIYLGQSVEIGVVDVMQGDKFSWSNGAMTQNQDVSPKETTTYTVTVTDVDGCTGVGSVTVVVRTPQCEEDVFLPTAFTPNGDDINPVLFVRSNFIDKMELIIYNRWKEEVFRSIDINTGWDGTFKGERLSPDVYAYWLRATCTDGETIERQGNINLIR